MGDFFVVLVVIILLAFIVAVFQANNEDKRKRGERRKRQQARSELREEEERRLSELTLKHYPALKLNWEKRSIQMSTGLCSTENGKRKLLVSLSQLILILTYFHLRKRRF